MSAKSNPVVRVTRRFAASAERVYAAWLDPQTTARWLFATEAGQMVRAEIDPRVGGRFTFTERRNGEEIEHTGEYLVLDRPRRLVFTFGLPKFSGNFDRVTLDLVPDGRGCELTLTHELKPEQLEYRERTESGWRKILAGLGATLAASATGNEERGQVTAPAEVRFVRLLPGPIERVWAYLTDPDKRATWLAGGVTELRPQGRVELKFRHADLAPDETPPEKYRHVHDSGASLVGRVTRCDPPRLLSYTWGGDEPGENSEVTFELTSKGQEVQLVLTHRRLTDPNEFASVGAGWHTHLAILIAKLNHATPPAFWSTHAQLEGEYSLLANSA